MIKKNDLYVVKYSFFRLWRILLALGGYLSTIAEYLYGVRK